LMLNATPETEVELRCGERAMFAGRMGRRSSNVAICVDRHIKRQDAG
jgi:flagellar motor switch protein FliM